MPKSCRWFKNVSKRVCIIELQRRQYLDRSPSSLPSQVHSYWFKQEKWQLFYCIIILIVGYIKSGRKGGPWPQVICAAAVGYYVGKYSNQLLRNKFYKDKLMLIPNSVLGESVRISKERKAKGKKSTPEQVTVLKEWFEKTFYSQSLPVGASLGLGAFIAVKSGTEFFSFIKLKHFKMSISLLLQVTCGVVRH